jgi:hypothetical protein
MIEQPQKHVQTGPIHENRGFMKGREKKELFAA